ncbi:MAG: hypothetical protein CVU57_04155 [Deltaproteobacteria bacterium HGW-Deltaproteobacteria-15]|jgi:DNA-binding response OmpR family regulator|nr:MAG: hypothetical protein CVU57_04155 [Deltaproteobacteria bacterium HGW-Deltaproteobacteria-15]
MGNSSASATPLILFAEDDEDFFMIIKDALNQVGFAGTLQLVKSSGDMVKYLQRRKTPTLIILDLETRPVSWREALKCIKEHERYRSIPTVVLTISGEQEDIALCQKYPSCSYVQKPETFQEWKARMEEVIRTTFS